jgi:hypothetical protein
MTRFAVRQDRIDRTIMDDWAAGLVFARTETNAAIGIPVSVAISRPGVGIAVTITAGIMVFLVIGDTGAGCGQGGPGFGSSFRYCRNDRTCGRWTKSFDRLDRDNRSP